MNKDEIGLNPVIITIWSEPAVVTADTVGITVDFYDVTPYDLVDRF